MSNQVIPIDSFSRTEQLRNNAVQENNDATANKLAVSIFKTAAMTAFITTTTISLGIVSVASALGTFGFRTDSPNDGLKAIVLIANIASAVITGAAIVNKKATLALALGCAITVGCFVISNCFPLLMITMSALTLISSGATLLIKAFKADKLALKVIAAHVLGLAVLIAGGFISEQIQIGVLTGAAIGAAIGVVATIVAGIAKRNGFATLAKAVSTIALLSSFATLGGVALGVFSRASIIAFFGGKLPAYASESLIKIFNAGAFAHTEEVAIAGIATAAAACTIKNDGKVTKIAKDFFASFIGSASIVAVASAIGSFHGPDYAFVLAMSIPTAVGFIAVKVSKMVESIFG